MDSWSMDIRPCPPHPGPRVKAPGKVQKIRRRAAEEREGEWTSRGGRPGGDRGETGGLRWSRIMHHASRIIQIKDPGPRTPTHHDIQDEQASTSDANTHKSI
ncbi:hypothetical protein L249_6312 [Ophiocordyceps polyrhachis-furcata BCC 54312]|uniref:Uncharacterized protein n=1 Tax=Ophiocordyceps polyrhachis-furcata BCC 54312 TaxID=1330021 RepID=A0A367L139_9HYPO|nr:hypothetical protein L249_6312 [Ophiocordyceps polyrhachis-furcata BCC 54312]